MKIGDVISREQLIENGYRFTTNYGFVEVYSNDEKLIFWRLKDQKITNIL